MQWWVYRPQISTILLNEALISVIALPSDHSRSWPMGPSVHEAPACWNPTPTLPPPDFCCTIPIRWNRRLHVLQKANSRYVLMLLAILLIGTYYSFMANTCWVKTTAGGASSTPKSSLQRILQNSMRPPSFHQSSHRMLRPTCIGL